MQSRYGVDVLMELEQVTYYRFTFRIKSSGKWVKVTEASSNY